MSKKGFYVFGFLLCCLASYNSLAQTGPGGVQQTNGSSELVMWLDASTISAANGDEISTWTDLSGYGNHAYSVSGNRPTYSSSWTNSRPSVEFTNANSDYLYVSNSTSTQLSQHEIYIVADFSSSSDSWAPFLVKADDWDWDNGYGIVRSSTDADVLAYDQDYYNYEVTASAAYDQAMLIDHFYNGNKIRLRRNGTSFGTVDYNRGISNSTNNMYIGVSPYYSGVLTDYLDGNIAEIIIFNDNHNQAERYIVQNYLASKYGINISNDRYAYDTNHGSGVIGIGRRNNGQVQSAQGQGILEISNASSLDSDDYLLIGHDDADLGINYDDAPAEYLYTINRVWRADKTNDVGTVSLSFDVDGLGFPTDASEYAILIDSDGDFSDATIHTTGASYSGTEISFTGVSLTDGDYITLAAYNSVIWDGSSYANGSGTSNAPNSSDSDRKFYVNGSGASLTADASAYAMVVSSGSDVTLNSNAELTISNAINNEGTITVTDGAGLNQTHSGADANSGSGTYVIQRDGLGTINGYNGLSSPIQSASITGTFSSSNPCDMFMFDGDQQLWKYDYVSGYSTSCLGNPVTFNSGVVYVGGDNIMNVGTGYFIPGSSSPTKTFSGTANNGEITTPVYVEVNPNNVEWTGDDWNLIGNPYPGAIDATAFWNENAVNNARITNAIYYWEDDASAGSGYNQNDDYASWNLLGGTSSSNSSEIPNGYISSCQGFWVIADANTDVVFNNTMRGGTNTQFFKTDNSNKIASARFWFSVENTNGDYNQLLIGFSNEATDGVDKAYDAIKQSGNPDMYMGSVINEEVYSIQAMSELNYDETRDIPLELFSNSTGLHYFKLDSIDKVNDTYEIMLLDKVKQKTYDIETGIATIYLDSAGTYKNRFFLSVNKSEKADGNGGDINTSVENLETNEKVFAYFNQNNITVNLTGTQSKAKSLTLTTLNGHQVITQTGSGNDIEYLGATPLSNGIYLISILHESGNTTTQKISIIR